MSPSSGSWRSGPGDIIDLDRYMRGSVRRARSRDSDDYERLVVDGGGCKARASVSGDARFKRTSLDSGVSAGSYRRARRRTKHRRNYHEDYNYPPHESGSAKNFGRTNSTNSMQAFRMTCEQALREQRQQIARVAELCERLTERAEKSERKETGDPLAEQRERVAKTVRNERKTPSGVSSEISSSSRSTKDPWRRDTNRTQECKTYKIIMSKLDELNRLFATRPPPARAPRPPRPPSSSSVSVCDKLVATEPQRTYNRVLAPSQRKYCPSSKVAAASLTSAARSSRHASARTVTQAFAVDIAPQDFKDIRANVLTESIVKHESSTESSRHSACDPRCGFDLNDPVHLYSQAKRLRASSERARRARSVEGAARAGAPWSGAGAGGGGGAARAPSLCALCRGYWRCLRQCVPALARAFNSYKCS